LITGNNSNDGTSNDSTQREKGAWLNRNVIGMGITSLLSDACHEMATTVLPGFLAVIGAPPSVLGLIEGISDGVSSTVKLWSGWISDKFGHRKTLTTIGYFLTGISQSIFAFALTWHLVLFGRVIGWFGRGFRGPIRNAMLADSVDPSMKGKAFGFHRAGDTIGAIVGPLLGVWLLSVWQPLAGSDPSQPFRNIFLITLIPGVLSAVTLAVTVTDKKRTLISRKTFWGTIRTLPQQFKNLLIGVGVFGLGDFAPTLLILAATTVMTPRYGVERAAELAGIMYVVRNVIYAIACYPIGAISDSIGRKKILVAGYFIAAVTIFGFLLSFLMGWSSPGYLFFLFALAGIFVAAEDTLESAITADLISSETRGVGMGVMGTVNGIGDFGASIIVGLVWTLVSPVLAFSFACVMMLLGSVLVLRIR
jgi:MFS family permease